MHMQTGNLRGPAWAGRVAERPGVPGKPGNADGGKGPQGGRNGGKETGAWVPGARLQAPAMVRKLQLGGPNGIDTDPCRSRISPFLQ